MLVVQGAPAASNWSRTLWGSLCSVVTLSLLRMEEVPLVTTPFLQAAAAFTSTVMKCGFP